MLGASILTRRALQGIHDISVILGMEASRDLEEETFSGVGIRPVCS